LTAAEEKALVSALGKHSAKIENGVLTITKTGKHSNRAAADFIHNMNSDLQETLKKASTIPVAEIVEEALPGLNGLERALEPLTGQTGIQALNEPGMLREAEAVAGKGGKILPAIGKMIAHHPYLSTAGVIGGLAGGYLALRAFTGAGKDVAFK